MQTGINRLINL